MVEEPEFEPEFYAKQIQMMEDRYSKIFKKWKISWIKYYSYIRDKLKNKQYWIWIYLCGFEKFLQEQGSKENRHTKLYKDADARIWRIIGDHFKVEEYVKSI